MRATIILALLLVAAPAAAGDAAAFQVIVHPSNRAQTISRRDLMELFLKKSTRWPDGSAVHPVEPPENSLTRAHFLNDVVGRSAFAVKLYWNKRLYAGREVPPLEKRSDEDVVAFVRATPGAVGYVTRGSPVAGVKVLKLKD